MLETFKTQINCFKKNANEQNMEPSKPNDERDPSSLFIVIEQTPQHKVYVEQCSMVQKNKQ
jgi:hypothetical protein